MKIIFMPISVAIILDTRRIKKRISKYPVKLRVTNMRCSKNYQTIYDLSEEDYQKLPASRVSDKLQDARKKLQEIKRSAENYINELDPFSFFEFEQGFIQENKLFRSRNYKPQPFLPIIDDGFDYSPFISRFPIFQEDQSSNGSMSVTFLSYMKKLLQRGSIGSALNYQRTYRSLVKFKGNVLLKEITVAYLYQYEKWMLDRHVSKTSIGIVLRPLRTIFNEAIEDGIIKRDKHYPFGRRRYQIPASRNFKKALTRAEIKEIYYYKPCCEIQQKAKAYWIFCYLANGMNVKDMVLLKYKNIQGDYLIFERAKTDRTARMNSRPITVYLTQDLKEILETYGTKSQRHNNEFIFPIMRQGLSLLEVFDLINSIRKFINRNMAKIGKDLGIEKRITTIVTRHSFSTQLKRAGVSTEYIQEALGHTNKSTTENYLDSFEKEIKKEYASKLTAFDD
jgi:integrase